MSKWESITNTATETSAKWTNSEVAKFHYFNPNGLYAAKKAVDERISEAVDAGKCASGAIIAYGIFNDYTTKQLIEYAMMKRVKWIPLSVTLSMLERDIRRAEEFLATLA